MISGILIVIVLVGLHCFKGLCLGCFGTSLLVVLFLSCCDELESSFIGTQEWLALLLLVRQLLFLLVLVVFFLGCCCV